MINTCGELCKDVVMEEIQLIDINRWKKMLPGK
jgi:hypothetical protein